MFITKTFSKFLPQISKNLYLFGTIKKFYLPDLGEKIKEATVKKWHVKVGDQVEEFQELADVSTDKMFTAITSAYKGKISKIFHKEDDICQIGQLFIEFDVEEDGAETVAPTKSDATSTSTQTQQQTQQTTQQQQQSSQKQGSKAQMAPAVRRLIKENNLNIDQITGTGKDGRILKQDVLNFLSQKSEPQAQQQKTTQTQTKTQPPVSFTMGDKIEKQTILMNDYQKGMQKSMTHSNTIPHFYIMEEIDVTEISKVREQVNKTSPLKITYMPFFMKAFSLALFDYPSMNSTYDIDVPFQFTTYKNHNISVAIDSPNGLVVPNIKNCQNLNIVQIQEELNRLRKSAEAGRVASKDISDGTVCISNVGNISGTYTGPLIMPPQVCIAGIGRMQDLPRFANNKSKEVVSKKILTTSFGCDHRVLDGATSARFLQKWKYYLETPSNFLLALK